MLGKFFSKSSRAERPKTPEMQTAAMRDALAKAATERPFIYQQVTGREIKMNVVAALAGDRPAHMPTAFAILGSLAGFAAASAARSKLAASDGSYNKDTMEIISAADGHNYYAGPLINDYLVSGPMSLWSLVAGMADKMAAVDLPDPEEISTHTMDGLGGPTFGQPRLYGKMTPQDTPANFVRHLMSAYQPLLTRHDPDSAKFYLSFAFAIQSLMEETSEDIAPADAAKIVMECAIPAACIDPAEVY